MPGLIVTLGGNSGPYERMLAKSEAQARQSALRINGALAGGAGGGHMRGGVITESVVLMRELSRGNFTRLPGSLTILAQRLGIVKILMKDNAT